jgi:aldehyde dehydrogenase (NAD+)
MRHSSYAAIVARQREFFATGATKDLSFRIDRLKELGRALRDYEPELLAALKEDLGKPPAEAFTSEIGFLYADIRFALRHIKGWARPRRAKNPPIHVMTTARIYPEPYGTTLIIAPWNYPVGLLLSPLVGAIAAGNTAVLKPSEIAAHTSRVIVKMIGATFDPSYVACVQGGAEAARGLLDEQFDYIFYTGSAGVGTLVMEAAARHLTPVTLELGGKSPCIVEDDAPLDVTAKRIVWGKFFNAGQTCVAPDYLLVNRGIKDALIDEMKRTIDSFYGADPKQSPDFGRIVSRRHFDRLTRLMAGDIVAGGVTDPKTRYIAPTIIDGVSGDDPAMADEIFGPILPVIAYDELGQAIDFVNARPKPLALYFFSKDKKKQRRVIRETSSGGISINDTVIQYTSFYLPFGGVGNSGMGSYHGKASFDTFTHYKGTLRQVFLIDLKARYLPYRMGLWFFRLVMRLFG